MARLDRGEAVKCANTYWDQPCSDNIVYLKNAAISIPRKYQEMALKPSEWSPRFLLTGRSFAEDGLFFVRNSKLQDIRTRHHFAESFGDDDIKLINGWDGLNDCAHFVSSCLSAGGVPINEPSVGPLIERLRQRSDVKVLAWFTNITCAQRILAADIMKQGDVMAFGTEKGDFSYGHAVLYMGEQQVANHSHLNHPTHIAPVRKKSTDANKSDEGAWMHYSTFRHPMVTLLHFSHDDKGPEQLAQSPAIGWWHLPNEDRSYYFAASGQVTWIRKKPANKSAPTDKSNRGHWFDRSDSGTSTIKICWPADGSYEEYQCLPGAAKMSGKREELRSNLTRL